MEKTNHDCFGENVSAVILWQDIDKICGMQSNGKTDEEL